MSAEQNTTELKPCPFCGARAEFATNSYAIWVACSYCQCHGEEGSKEEAIAAWNKRAQQPTPEQQPKLTLALPIFEKRRIVIVSDEMIDDERLVCVAIDDKDVKPAQPTPVPAEQVSAIVHDALLRAYSALVSCSIKENSDFREDQYYFNEVKVRDAMRAIKPILDATPAAPQPEEK